MIEHPLVPLNPLSSLLLLLGVVASIVYWMWRSPRSIDRLPVMIGGIFGGFVGAKLGFVAAEWLFVRRDDPQWIFYMMSGKTILGGLLGGWLGVEIAKRLAGRREWFGDEFAMVLPLGIGLGRASCLVHGCCRGVRVEYLPEWLGGWLVEFGWERWPAPVAELLFQLLFFVASLSFRHVDRLRGQWFHLYLISYGIFRIVHEGWRETPRSSSGLTPYMLLAGLCVVSGAVAFAIRFRSKMKR